MLTFNELKEIIDMISESYEKTENWKAVPVKVQFNEKDFLDLEVGSFKFNQDEVVIISPVEFESIEEVDDEE